MVCASLPVDTTRSRVTSPFGWRTRPSGPDLHTGVDIAAGRGTPILAMLPGRVVVAAPSGQLSGYGNVVVLEHGPRLFSLYAHLDRLDVGRGDLVAQGAQLGTMGDTFGSHDDPNRRFGSSGVHLHLEFLDRWPPRGRDADRLNPADVLRQVGVILPRKGPPLLACSEEKPHTLTRLTREPSSSDGGGGVVVLLLLAALAGQQ